MPQSLSDELRPLLDPRAYPGAVSAVVLLQTPISWVLLAGEFAYKIKRPVRLPFVDQRELAQRHWLCQEELRLNRRFAPQLYLDVVTIGREQGELRIGGGTPVLEYAVRMRRFDRAQELDRLLGEHGIEPRELARFGRRLALLHAGLPRVPEGDRFGTPDAVGALIMRSFRETCDAAAGIDALADVASLEGALRAALERAAAALVRRRGHGCMRECHGDLHARNLVRIEGELVAFDCIEFEPAFRWIDVADDAALLHVDLEARGCGEHAWAFWNEYLAAGGDYDAHAVFDLYKAHRALVRAKVAALSLREAAAAEAAVLRREWRGLATCARRALSSRPRWLILMSGLSGSGKSWLASRLAQRLGMSLARSDVERRRGVGPSMPGRYDPERTRAVYARLLECARSILDGGYSALIDATFLHRRDRAEFRALAVSLGVPVLVLRCHAPLSVMRARLTERARAAIDPSEADAQVLEWQMRQAEPLTREEGLRCIELATDGADPLADALRAIAAEDSRLCG